MIESVVQIGDVQTKTSHKGTGMTELKCPKCGEILEDFVLTERGRCAHCGAEAKEIITLLQTQLDGANRALNNIFVVASHSGTINEVLRIVTEAI